MKVETSFLNKFIIHPSLRIVNQYIDIIKADFKMNDTFLEDLIMMYSFAKIYTTTVPQRENVIIVNQDDPFGIKSLFFSTLMPEKTLIFSTLSNSKIKNKLITFLTMKNIFNLHPTTNLQDSYYINNIESYVEKHPNTFCVQIGEDSFNLLVKTDYFITNRFSEDLSILMDSDHFTTFSKKTLDLKFLICEYLPF